MTAHKRLPNRRHAETFELTVGGLRYVCTVGRFGDGMIRRAVFLEPRIKQHRRYERARRGCQNCINCITSYP
jgi:hypothetical protein